MVPPTTATVLWVLPTPFDDIRCVSWRRGRGWMVGIYFGPEPLDLEIAPSSDAVRIWADVVRRRLVAIGFGRGGRFSERPALEPTAPSDC